jgi:hypothetical protein
LSQTRTSTTELAVAGPWDISDDKKIGLEEAIYILQVVSGMRP